MHPLGRAGVTLAAAALTMVFEAQALATPTKKECFSSSQIGQDLLRAGKLNDARAHFLTCAAASCPEVVRADCAEHVDEVSRALPTVVFDARDADGSDLSAVKVTMDGAPFLDHLDGRSVPVDPGAYRFTFEVEGRAPVARSLVIREGEKERRERIVFPALAAPPAPVAPVMPSAPTPSPALPAPSASSGGTQRTVAYALGAAAVGGIGLGTAYGLVASSTYKSARTDCGSGCSATSSAASEKSRADGQAAVSTIAFIAGGAALTAGLVLFLTAPKGAAQDGTKAAVIAVVPTGGPSGGGVLLVASF